MGGQPPKDNSAEVARIEQEAARQAREEAERKRQRDQAEFDKRLNSAFGSGLTSAEDYFTSRGLDPSQYRGAITNKANQIRSSVPNLAGDPGSYFAALGESIFGQLQEGERGKALRGINTIAPTGFANTRIQNTADDDTIAAILAEQENKARSYVDNLKSRGVVTDSGYQAALNNLLGQKPGAQSRLSEIGTGILETGRGGADNLANTFRSAASNLNLGDVFDPYSKSTDLNNYFSDFFNNLGTKLRGSAPTNLFDTSGLASLAGAAQGAGNTAFNPRALAGIFDEEEEDDEKKIDTNPF